MKRGERRCEVTQFSRTTSRCSIRRLPPAAALLVGLAKGQEGKARGRGLGWGGGVVVLHFSLRRTTSLHCFRVESIFRWYLEQRKNERSGCLAGFVDALPRLGEAAPAGAGAARR
jgi:hypothetical protein